ncbi:hypothetical protein [Thermococcus sp. CX2]|nr:hypothetical protein [Thermococcus sp. CX2]
MKTAVVIVRDCSAESPSGNDAKTGHERPLFDFSPSLLKGVL